VLFCTVLVRSVAFVTPFAPQFGGVGEAACGAPSAPGEVAAGGSDPAGVPPPCGSAFAVGAGAGAVAGAGVADFAVELEKLLELQPKTKTTAAKQPGNLGMYVDARKNRLLPV